MSDHLSDQDKSIWKRVADTINPLSDRMDEEVSESTDTENKLQKNDLDKKNALSKDSTPSPGGRAKKSHGYTSHKSETKRASSMPPLADFIRHPRGRVPGLDRATQRRFRTGKMTIDARLDLHGMTRQKADKELRQFIQTAHDRQNRMCLIITGKGEGILRRKAYEFLVNPGQRKYILGLANAQPRHGGKGAYYVLLRRRR